LLEERNDMKNKHIKRISFESYRQLFCFSQEHDFEIIGNKNEGNNFDVIKMDNEEFLFGIIYYYYGIAPQMLFVDNYNYLLVGWETKILLFEIKSKTKILIKEFAAPFFEFISVKKHKLVLAILELDVCAINSSGKLIWSNNVSDIIIDFKLSHNDNIYIKCMDDNEFLFSVSDGSLK
jgi:hypothetical protein